MCGRYTLQTPQPELIERFGATPEEPLEPRYNCAPGQSLPVITNQEPDRITQFRWGLTPAWADEKQGLINARAETLGEKRSFAEAYEARRCLVPCDGFYEWADLGDGKRPYRVSFDDDRPFALAGLWERWEPPTQQLGLAAFGDESGNTAESAANPEPISTFTIITTTPNELISTLHHRMAVILDPESEPEWLHGDCETADSLLAPYPADEMVYEPVSTRVNDPANDDPSLIEPVST